MKGEKAAGEPTSESHGATTRKETSHEGGNAIYYERLKQILSTSLEFRAR